jgi:hypothetical protein
MNLIERAPELYTLWVCQDCAQPAHGPGSRCPSDRRRTWTQMGEVEYVRADFVEGNIADHHQMIVDALEDNERLRKAIEAHQAVEYADLPGNCDEAFLVALAEIDATLYAALTEEKR